eukprot:CAMPEP_0198504162 /NCGR_PEP_ID=MMETSP1462-20131121/10342_1 /TAXON_ID=1333877 /ORGANISM="Brandtodinium nutriculum, Strain RCC3387" /LENGTH=50 /DNA_ID=CAMNT_0044233317 /DNA_START=377 /DNA_END=526 /DNA_ORIENTATION=+
MAHARRTFDGRPSPQQAPPDIGAAGQRSVPSQTLRDTGQARLADAAALRE